jgi:hypothetical protein
MEKAISLKTEIVQLLAQNFDGFAKKESNLKDAILIAIK